MKDLTKKQRVVVMDDKKLDGRWEETNSRMTVDPSRRAYNQIKIQQMSTYKQMG